MKHTGRAASSRSVFTKKYVLESGTWAVDDKEHPREANAGSAGNLAHSISGQEARRRTNTWALSSLPKLERSP